MPTGSSPSRSQAHTRFAEMTEVLAMAAGLERRSATERELRIKSLAHFTLPIRDFNVDHRFYVRMLGGEFAKEPDWDRLRSGRSAGAHIAIQMFNGDGYLSSSYGQPALDQLHPPARAGRGEPREA